jgi:hypothetical protein
MIGHHDIQLSPSALLMKLGGMKTEKSIQTDSKRSVPLSPKETSAPQSVDDYRVKNMLPITGQQEQRLNVLLGILVGYQASLLN